MPLEPVSRSRARARRGANAIEFALTLPIFLAIVLGVMDYGYLFAVQAGLDNAVSLACREGALVDPKIGTPIAKATTEFAARSGMWCGPGCSFDASALTVGQYSYPNQALRCRVTRPIAPLSGFVPYPGSVESSSYYRVEWQVN
jgi:uncharacterized membrane protein